MAGEFVEGWFAAQVLGEGAYGEVRLLVHARTGACVALKAVRAEGAEGEGGGSREAALHRALRHPHVLRCYGERHHRHLHYLFLEYAQGGELFDRIEPDVGMSEAAARRYWRQALAGLRYLHERGVAHRDLKPENLLLDHHDQIKISDFGMATLFRHGSRERLLTRVCGTVPYAAPEVLRAARAPYRAPPADLWAAAVVLLAMLAGELPWERAHEDEPRYAAWSRWAGGEGGAGEAPGGVWRKLGGDARALLRRLLQPAPARRPALPALLRHRWLRDPGPAETSAEAPFSEKRTPRRVRECERAARVELAAGGWGGGGGGGGAGRGGRRVARRGRAERGGHGRAAVALAARARRRLAAGLAARRRALHAAGRAGAAGAAHDARVAALRRGGRAARAAGRAAAPRLRVAPSAAAPVGDRERVRREDARVGRGRGGRGGRGGRRRGARAVGVPALARLRARLQAPLPRAARRAGPARRAAPRAPRPLRPPRAARAPRAPRPTRHGRGRRRRRPRTFMK